MKHLILFKKIPFIIFTVIMVLLTSCSEGSKSTINLHQLFSDHMVIQRNKDIHIFGTASPGLKITAEIAGNKASTKADNDGNFNIQLPELKPGGPYEIVISTKDTIIKLDDILIGDVWVCSGQSNMEFKLKNAKRAHETLSKSRPDMIRMVDVPWDLEFKPLDDFRNPMRWFSARSDSIKEFSAVAYYFAEELQKKLGIPIGLIGSNWGGTAIESWIQAQALDSFPQYKERINYLKNITVTVKEIEDAGKKEFDKVKEELFASGIGIDEKWYFPSYNSANWKPIDVPGFWEKQIPEMKDFDGVVWFKKEFDLPKDFTGKDIDIWLSQIHDYDITWLNGVKLGEHYSPFDWRGYSANKSMVKEKNNVLIVRVYNRKFNGGFDGIPAYFDCYPVGEKEKAISLSGKWSYKIAKKIRDTFKIPLVSKKFGPNEFPSMLNNAMINPMTKFPVKGVIWYQGEANADKAFLYRKTFPALIKNWRQQWNIGDFPFYFIQLANYGHESGKLGDSFWAELREAQTMTLSVPNTGMATIIDIGNPTDIHPLNKKDVGLRLAYNALHKTYGLETLFSGPAYKRHAMKNNEVIIEFDHLGSGLITSDGMPPREFILAGKDQIFYPAKAKIVNNTIVLNNKNVAKPVSVRYAWKNSPEVNLFNKEGLPAIPFRTDDWEEVTLKNSDL